jgi:hypothetical protein
MSQAVRLSSKLSKDDETNGLDQLASRLAKDPHQVICAITWLTVQKVTDDIETGNRIPTVQVKRIEPIGTVDAVPDAVIALAAELYSDRLGGRTPLPFDVIETIEGGYVLGD